MPPILRRGLSARTWVTLTKPSYEYVALIDESGDTGLQNVKPLDPGGSSEWLIISAVLFRRSNEPDALAWGRELMAETATRQTREFNFARLRPHRQLKACQIMAGKPMRIFTVASNKKNMRRYKNPFAEAKSVSLVGRAPGFSYDWFYYWMSRILLEKMTDWVYRHSVFETGSPQKLKLIFSERKSMRYDELGFYYQTLREHDFAGTQWIDIPIKFEVLHHDLLDAIPHNARADMNLCDTAASSFFAAVAKYDREKPVYTAPAEAMGKLMARKPKQLHAAGYGVKLMPSPHKARLDPDQAQIFRFFGYDRGLPR